MQAVVHRECLLGGHIFRYFVKPSKCLSVVWCGVCVCVCMQGEVTFVWALCALFHKTSCYWQSVILKLYTLKYEINFYTVHYF